MYKIPMHLNLFKHALIQCFLILFISGVAFGQEGSDLPASSSSKQLLEIPDDPFIKVNHEGSLKTPAYTYSTPGFFTTQVNVDEDGNNIVGDAANEPSIAISPADHNNMVIGWRHFETISNNFRQAGVAYTSDGGETWSFDGVIDPGIFRSDPVLDSDKGGSFFYNSLTVQSGDYWCDVYKSEDGGETWDFGTFAEGGDKQWFSIDKSGSDGAGNIYHYWSSASICPPYNFTRSVDNGLTYESCSSVDGDPYWGTTTIDGSGVLYVCGYSWNNFIVSRSSDAQYPGDMSWDYYTNVSLDGSIVGFGGYSCPNPNGLLGQTIIAIDSSGGVNHDNVYLLCSVERYSVNDPCDVMFSRSTDGGETWSTPERINDDSGNNAYQWFGTMSVAPDGRIDVVWLDTRENPGELDSKLYYAASWDGGLTWSQNIPLGESFDPHVGWPSQDKMGDYFDMISDEDGAHLAWSNTLNGEQDVYYAQISPDITGLSSYAPSAGFTLDQNIPNPCKENTTIGYRLDSDAKVSLEVLDITGRLVTTLVDESKSRGQHHVRFNVGQLQKGIYYYRLKAGRYTETKKMMVMD